MGSVDLFSVVVKHGDLMDLVDFRLALRQEKARNSGDSHLTEVEKEDLCTNALIARAKLREGRIVAKRCTKRREEQLSDEEQKLVLKLHSGELERDAVEANKKYGIGEEVTRMSTEEAVLYRRCRQ